MQYPALNPLPADFLARWSTWYPEAPPVGFLLRGAYEDRWLRIHSLPESKRYPETASESAELVRRHNAVAAHLLGGEGAACAVLVQGACTGRYSRGVGRDAALSTGDLPRVTRLPAALWDEQTGYFAGPVCLYGGAATWRAGAFDGFIFAVAEDRARGVLVSASSGEAYAPYDGGADLFFATTAARDAAREHYRAWLPVDASGL